MVVFSDSRYMDSYEPKPVVRNIAVSKLRSHTVVLFSASIFVASFVVGWFIPKAGLWMVFVSIIVACFYKPVGTPSRAVRWFVGLFFVSSVVVWLFMPFVGVLMFVAGIVLNRVSGLRSLWVYIVNVVAIPVVLFLGLLHLAVNIWSPSTAVPFDYVHALVKKNITYELEYEKDKYEYKSIYDYSMKYYAEHDFFLEVEEGTRHGYYFYKAEHPDVVLKYDDSLDKLDGECLSACFTGGEIVPIGGVSDLVPDDLDSYGFNYSSSHITDLQSEERNAFGVYGKTGAQMNSFLFNEKRNGFDPVIGLGMSYFSFTAGRGSILDEFVMERSEYFAGHDEHYSGGVDSSYEFNKAIQRDEVLLNEAYDGLYAEYTS